MNVTDYKPGDRKKYCSSSAKCNWKKCTVKNMSTHQCRRQPLISSPLQTREDVLQRTQQHIFLDEVRLESKACTVQKCIEITVHIICEAELKR